MSKVFMCWTLNSGTTYYRMMNFVKYARDKVSFGMSKWSPNIQGVADWEYHLDQEQVRKDLSVLLDNCDMVIAQKFHSVGGLAVMDTFKHQYPKKPFYTELDDNIFAVNPNSPAHDNYNPGSQLENIAIEQIQLSTGLIVSTDYLRRAYEGLNPNIWVIPNGIDFEIWDKLKSPKENKKIRIGWAGGGSHDDDLEFIYPAIERIIENHKNVEFVFMGGVPRSYLNNPKIKVIKKWLPIDEYPQALKDMGLDIALAPLRDNDFNRAKSNLRWLEYSAMKVPTIASNVEPFKCIEDGKTGLLVTEVDEWSDAIKSLIESESDRKKIGESAYQAVKKNYNVKNIAKEYAKNIKLMILGKARISKEAAIEALR